MSRVAKTHPRIEAYGSVDELNATLGWARAEGPSAANSAAAASSSSSSVNRAGRGIAQAYNRE